MKYFFIINPNAGIESSKNKFIEELEIIQHQINSLDIEYFYFITEYEGFATEIVKKICDFYSNETIRIIVCGGTGSFYEAINGVNDFSKVELALYPMGTYNDVIKGFGLSYKSFKDIKNLVEGNTVKIDIIKINDKYAANIVSIGLDAKIAYDANTNFMRVLGNIHKSLRVFVPIVKNLFSKISNTYNIEIDGANYSGNYTIVTIINSYCYGGNFVPRRDSKNNDGILNVLLLTLKNIFQILPVAFYMKHGVLEDKTDIAKTADGKTIKLSRKDGSDIVINIDGEVIKAKEARIEIMPSTLNFVIPKKYDGDK